MTHDRGAGERAAHDLVAVVARLVPPGTHIAACPTVPSTVHLLADGERHAVAGARAVRRDDFAAGRWCAHRVLAALGADVAVIGRGTRGEPQWPASVTGSISHSAGLAVAVAAPAAIGSLGVDIEVADALTPDLWPVVLTEPERARCAAAGHPAREATRIYAAKEAVFKALYPVVRREIDYLDAIAAADGSSVRIAEGDLATTVDVWTADAGPMVVAVAVNDPVDR